MFVVSDPDQPYLMQWSLTVEREILPNTALTLGYSGSRGVHIPQATEKNRPFASRTPEGGYFYECNFVSGGQCFTDRKNPNFTAITDRVWDRNSSYNAFKLGLMRRFTSGLAFQISYQFQKSIDEGGTIAGSPRETVNDQWLGSNWLDRKADRGPSNFNVPNVFTANYTWDLPFGGGSSGFTGTLIKGWTVSGILNLFDGAPQNIEGAARVTCTSGCSNIRPDLIPGGDNDPNTGDPEAWFGEVEDNFEVQAPGTFRYPGTQHRYGSWSRLLRFRGSQALRHG